MREIARTDAELAEKELNIDSAGTYGFPGSPMSYGAAAALTVLGVRAQEHRAKPISQEIVDKADLILTMERSHLEQIFEFFPGVAQKAHTLKAYAAGNEKPDGPEDVKDPYGAPNEVYIGCAKEIKRALEALLPRLKAEISDQSLLRGLGQSPKIIGG